jgi:hypothetical protein
LPAGSQSVWAPQRANPRRGISRSRVSAGYPSVSRRRSYAAFGGWRHASRRDDHRGNCARGHFRPFSMPLPPPRRIIKHSTRAVASSGSASHSSPAVRLSAPHLDAGARIDVATRSGWRAMRRAAIGRWRSGALRRGGRASRRESPQAVCLAARPTWLSSDQEVVRAVHFIGVAGAGMKRTR